MSDEHACCCSDRKRQRTDEEYKRLMNRLSRIEGQIRGVKGMLENDAYCTDIVLQVSAITRRSTASIRYFLQSISGPVWLMT